MVADEPWIRNQVRGALYEPDFQVAEIADPRAVAAAVIQHPPDVVVTDLQVGTMGGMAITRELRDAAIIARFPPVPVVMLVDRRADVFLARRGGASAWVVKPFTAQELRRAVSEALAPSSQPPLAGTESPAEQP